MTTRLRFLTTGALTVAVGGVSVLSLLTALHHLLSTPAFEHFDSTLQIAIHQLAHPSLTRLMLALTWMGAIKIFAPALSMAVLWLAWRGRQRDAALLGAGMAGAFLLNEALKLHFHRARPRLPWSIGDEHTFSFPSGHSLFAVVLYGTFAYLALSKPRPQRRLAVLIPAVLMPFCIGLSRIYLGMHYPTDVLAGWLAGGVWLGTILAIDKALPRTPARITQPAAPTRPPASNSGPPAPP